MSVQPGPAEIEATIASGGVVLFPSDTVYGLACDPANEAAIERLYALKGRRPDKAAAVMFFALDAALAALPELGERTRSAMRQLMPGGVTFLVPNPQHRFPLACRADPGTMGLRVINVPALDGVQIPVLQSSANLSGEPEARTLATVEPKIRAASDLAIDGGLLPGVASSVIDLRRYEVTAEWSVVRPGAVPEDRLHSVLDARPRAARERLED